MSDRPDSCASCGRAPRDDEEASALLTWSRGTEGSRTVWTCRNAPALTARSIEGKLDSAWW